MKLIIKDRNDTLFEGVAKDLKDLEAHFKEIKKKLR
jgi:hypothetical protein